MLIGKLNSDDTAATTPASVDLTRVQQHAVPTSGLVARIAALVDGLAAGTGVGLMRAVVYDAARALVAASDAVEIPAGMPAQWKTFRFATPPAVVAGAVNWGVQYGGDLTMRVYPGGANVAGGSTADSYADGPLTTFPPLGTLAPLALFADVFEPYEPPAGESDFFYARLPFAEAQRVLSSTGVVRNTAQGASVAWHGRTLDPERGSFAVVRAGGEFDDAFVGERIRLTTEFNGVARSAYAFVHNVADIDPRDEISVTRRVWLALALPGVDRLQMTVERMA